jgi:DeoR family transcriptional regulator, copper-sensing transcriptional repressor
MKQAEQFKLGFGGDIYNFEEAIKNITTEMYGKVCYHSKK